MLNIILNSITRKKKKKKNCYNKCNKKYLRKINMIKDNLKNAQFYYGLGEKFKKAFEYLKSNDLLKLDNGKYEIDGENIFVSVQDYNTKPESEGKFETHKKYADIQFIIKGEEKIGYTDVTNCTNLTNYDEEKDIEFLKNNEPENHFAFAKEGDFLIFLPQDAHMPCISICDSSYVKKAVVKIKL